MGEPNVILEGIVGSHAYGLATPDSDIDKLGIFLAPLEHVLGLKDHEDTLHGTSDEVDYTYHEFGKYMRLALKANPTVLELLFLEEHTVVHPAGQMLLGARHMFLSQQIRNTYGGYALQQVKRLERRGDGSFKSKLRKRKDKHKRHIARLMLQCVDTLQYGTLRTRLNPAQVDEVRKVEQMTDEELVEWFETMDNVVKTMPTDLPHQPDWEWADQFAILVRRKYDG